MITVYVGAAIDSSRGSPAQQFEELCNAVLEGLGQNGVIYNPLTAFVNAHKTRTENTNAYVVKVNMEALLAADLAVFSWTDTPSFGVPLEIDQRCRAAKPFVIWDRSSKGPGIYMEYAASIHGRIVRTRADLVRVVEEFNQDHAGHWQVREARTPDVTPKDQARLVQAATPV